MAMVFCGVMVRRLKRYSDEELNRKIQIALTLHLFNDLTTLQPRKEIFEERSVNGTALWMILHTTSKRIFSQRYLLDDTIVGGPRFDFAAICQPFDCLMMRAVHFRKTVRGAAGMTQ